MRQLLLLFFIPFSLCAQQPAAKGLILRGIVKGLNEGEIVRLVDVNNTKDMDLAKKFFETYKWGPTGCPFVLEVPWENVPDMLKDKITKYHLNIKG